MQSDHLKKKQYKKTPLPLTNSIQHSLTHSLAHSLTRSLTHSLTHSLAHSLARPLARSPARSLTHCYRRKDLDLGSGRDWCLDSISMVTVRASLLGRAGFGDPGASRRKDLDLGSGRDWCLDSISMVTVRASLLGRAGFGDPGASLSEAPGGCSLGDSKKKGGGGDGNIHLSIDCRVSTSVSSGNI